MKKGERMLPSDFLKKIKYDSLDNTEKKLEEQDGFFVFPEDLKGNLDKGVRDFLVFYFDNTEQYEIVRKFFEVKSHRKSHPELDSVALYKLVKKAVKDGN